MKKTRNYICCFYIGVFQNHMHVVASVIKWIAG